MFFNRRRTMRKGLLQFALLLAAVVLSTYSVSAAERPSFGALGGFHIAEFSIDPDPTDATLDAIRRFNIGGLVELGLSPNASLQARCMYVQKGARLEDIEEEIDLSATTTIDYITVPVLLKLQVDTARIRPYAVVGPELGFKASAGATLETTADVPRDLLKMVEDELSDQINNELRSFDIALDFGGGIEIPTGRMSILIEALYSLGLRNLADPVEGEEGSAKTRAFLFDIGIRF
jgi:hypothetical protein